ncbi:MAG: glycosyltransferase family 4 protein [Burkholderiaceae bacterium]|nr:glycosyltransferase family 4 protein [Burkholderiaceae bacterium]
MNILFCSVPFRPSVGGIETVSALLAERFHRSGHQVVLVTQTASNVPDTDMFEVVRQPSARRLFALVRWAEVVFHNNISLRFAWPQVLLRRPWVVAHHTWIPTRGWAARVKRWVLPQARHIAVSQAVADSLAVPCTVVPNPYADDAFSRIGGIARDRELVFVGRLVTDKGVDLLIDALALLARRGRHVRLTVVGDGPEGAALREQAHALNVADRVDFVGRRVGPGLVATLNAHQVLVVPSVWEEPFGVVVLEGMACGCVPLVTRSGGLPEAVGACGVVLPHSDRPALATTLADGIDALLGDLESVDHYRQQVAPHLERHTRDRVARDYLQVLTDVCSSHAAQSAARVV